MPISGEFTGSNHSKFYQNVQNFMRKRMESLKLRFEQHTLIVLRDWVRVGSRVVFRRINEEVREWIKGSKGRFSPGYLRGRHSVVWLRKFSHELAQNCDCSTLEHVLATIPGAKRMIMGHTIQATGINGVCGNRAIRIDVGMSKGCINGLPEVLEISGNSEVRVLASKPSYRTRLEAARKEGLGLVLAENGPRPVEVKA